MKNNSFDSGTYTGFFNYTAGGTHHPMALSLSFVAGKVAGQGRDQYGPFIIQGRFDTRSGECNWTKTYSPERQVAYRGFFEDKGIWGTWEIAGVRTGGFQIWRAMEAPLSRSRALLSVRRSHRK